MINTRALMGLLTLLMLTPLYAQDADESEQRDELEPAVSGPELAPDVRRKEDANSVMDEIDLDRTRITGNQELPKVLYIVPWKKSDLGDLVGRPVNTLLDEVLAPLDREVFIRQVTYFDDVTEPDTSVDEE